VLRRNTKGTFETGGDYLCVVVPPDFAAIREDGADDFE
jgi:hypothetical protein